MNEDRLVGKMVTFYKCLKSWGLKYTLLEFNGYQHWSGKHLHAFEIMQNGGGGSVLVHLKAETWFKMMLHLQAITLL